MAGYDFIANLELASNGKAPLRQARKLHPELSFTRPARMRHLGGQRHLPVACDGCSMAPMRTGQDRPRQAGSPTPGLVLNLSVALRGGTGAADASAKQADAAEHEERPGVTRIC